MGCGAGSPLLHPAHALPTGEVTFGAGVSSAFVVGDADVQIDEAREVSVPGSAVAGDQQEYAEGIIAYAATPPGLAPWVGGRVGIGEDSDAGVAYTGRAVRADARHAFEGKSTAVSAGLGLSGLLLDRGDAPESGGKAIPGFDSGQVTGFGADIPIIAGWRSDADLVSAWGGVRGSFTSLRGDLALIITDPSTPVDAKLEASRWYAGGLLGVSAGVEPVRVAVEVEVGWSHTSGSVDLETATGTTTRNADVQAWTIVPAGAVVGRF